jgi:hypothetical protein
VQWRAARDQQSKCRHGGQELGDHRRRGQHLLEIVHQQQCLLTIARGTCALRQIGRGEVCEPQGLGNRARRETGIPDRGQGREQDAELPVIRHEASELQRQTALSDAPRADQCDQTCTRLGEPLLQHLEILVAAEKTRERQRQYRDGQLLERGDGSRRSCTAQKGIARRARQIQRR